MVVALIVGDFTAPQRIAIRIRCRGAAESMSLCRLNGMQQFAVFGTACVLDQHVVTEDKRLRGQAQGGDQIRRVVAKARHGARK